MTNGEVTTGWYYQTTRRRCHYFYDGKPLCNHIKLNQLPGRVPLKRITEDLKGRTLCIHCMTFKNTYKNLDNRNKRTGVSNNNGKKDYETLLKIKQFASGYCKLMGIPITFHIDRDENDFETAIIFDWEHPANSRRPHETEDWGAVKYPKHMVCPDLVCFELGLIIEFEEEHGNKKTGARLATKGHANKGDIDTPRDCNRNMLYSAAGYQLVRIYKSDFTKDPLCWKSELADAINDRWTMRKLRTTTAEVLAKIVDIDKQ